jgi:hypothetical protein
LIRRLGSEKERLRRQERQRRQVDIIINHSRVARVQAELKRAGQHVQTSTMMFRISSEKPDGRSGHARRFFCSGSR